MRLYLLKSIDSRGRIRYEFIWSDPDRLADQLRDKTPLFVLGIPFVRRGFAKRVSKRISREDAIEILDSLHILLRAGLSLQKALKELLTEQRSRSSKLFLQKALKNIEEGGAFWEVFEEFSDSFGKEIVSLIKISEKSGSLQSGLKKSSELLQKKRELVRGTIQSAIYPLFAVIAIGSAMGVWVYFVLPQLLDTFYLMELEPPAVSIWMMKGAEFLKEHIFSIGSAFAIASVIFYFILFRWERGRYFFERMLLVTPFVGRFLLYYKTALLFEYLKIAIGSGMPLVEALKSSAEATESPLFKEKLYNVIKLLEKGFSFSEALSKDKIFTPLSVRLVSIAEESGDLEEQMRHLQNYYYDKLRFYMNTASKSAEPVIVVILGLFMALVMISLISPVYDLVSKVSA